jgi:hypothetical protein
MLARTLFKCIPYEHVFWLERSGIVLRDCHYAKNTAIKLIDHWFLQKNGNYHSYTHYHNFIMHLKAFYKLQEATNDISTKMPALVGATGNFFYIFWTFLRLLTSLQSYTHSSHFPQPSICTDRKISRFCPLSV